jgi:hypothetical protein
LARASKTESAGQKMAGRRAIEIERDHLPIAHEVSGKEARGLT